MRTPFGFSGCRQSAGWAQSRIPAPEACDRVAVFASPQLTIPMRRTSGYLLAAAVVAATAACSKDTSLTAPSPDALQAAEQLTRFADSISASDKATASTVRELADVVRRSAAVATVSLSIDGQAHDFSAVANESVLLIPCTVTASSGDQSTAPCGDVPFRRRSLVAWEPGTRSMLALTTLDEAGAIAHDPTVTQRPVAARLQLFTGDGRHWWGVSGTQSNTMTLGSLCRSVTTQYGDRQV